MSVREIYDLNARRLQEEEDSHRAMIREQFLMRQIMINRIRQQELQDEEEAKAVAAEASASHDLASAAKEFEREMKIGMGFLQAEAYPAAVNQLEQALKDLDSHRKKQVYGYIFDCRYISDAEVDAIFNPFAVQYYKDLGWAHYQTKEYSKAIENFTKVLKISPNDFSVMNLRAKAEMDWCLRMHNSDFPTSVIVDLIHSLELSNAQEFVDFIQAKLKFVLKDYDAAISGLQRTLAQPRLPSMERAEAFTLLGDIRVLQNKKESAIEVYHNALEIIPDKMRFFEEIEILHTKRGDLFMQLGKEPEAMREYQQAFKKTATISCASYEKLSKAMPSDNMQLEELSFREARPLREILFKRCDG